MESEQVLDHIDDFITGKSIPLMGSEENRQAVERFLVMDKGYDKKDIVVDEGLSIQVEGQTYASRLDLVVYVDGKRFMVIKCAPGSLGSREREILAAARLVQEPPVPFAAVSDGKTAIVLDGLSGDRAGEGLAAVLSKEDAKIFLNGRETTPLAKNRLEKEALLFRSYDSMNVNRTGVP